MSNGGSSNGQVIQIEGLPLNVPVVVTEQIGAASDVPAAQGGGAAAAVIERQLRDVLGWTPRAADTQGLMRALEKSYSSYVDGDGYTRWAYTPRGTAITLESAEITGAQGSIYMRAKAAYDDMAGLLEGMEPMREEADDEAAEAIRAIVGCTLSDIVDELGREGGPTVPLVDELFDQLLGVFPPGGRVVETDPELVDGDVGRLRDRFYFSRQFISGLGDETNFTKFLAFVDYATSLRMSWEAQRANFDPNVANPFFGPQLARLRLVLETIGQNVEEAYAALDAAGIDQAERESLSVGSRFLQPTLEWVQEFVTGAAPRLLDEAGVDGAKSLLPRLSAMAEAVDAFIPPVDGFPTLYNTPLVFATLQSLQRGLVTAFGIVDKVTAGPGAATIVVPPETVPVPPTPTPDDTPAPPVIITVEDGRPAPAPTPVESHYTIDIHGHKENDEYRLVSSEDSSKTYEGRVQSFSHDVARVRFDISVVGPEPPFYKLQRRRSGGQWRTVPGVQVDTNPSLPTST